MQPRTTHQHRTSALLALIALAWTGCGISPKPEPPSVDAVPVLDPATVVSQQPSDGEPDPTLAGGAGAVDPAEGVVRITSLDSIADPDDAPVQSDGSFASWLELWPGDEVRLQVVTDSTRSEVFDFVVGDGKSGPLPAPRPLACLSLDPPTQLALAHSQSVVVRNQCDFDVRIDAASMRRPAAGWSVGMGQSWPAVLATGDQLTVAVEAPAGAVEEVFFIQAGDPELDRRPITAFRDE